MSLVRATLLFSHNHLSRSQFPFLFHHREEPRYVVKFGAVEPKGRVIRKQDLSKLRVAEDNDAEFGEINYMVEPDFIYTGWITTIKTQGKETLYGVMYEDCEETFLTLSELNNPKLVSTNKADLEKLSPQYNRNRQPRRKACGECANCTKDDCGECRQCKDMPKFGGNGGLRERCRHRRCKELV